jgi:hypothetical protein
MEEEDLSQLEPRNFEPINGALREALAAVRQPLEDAGLAIQFEDMEVLLDAGEYGVALEQLCGHLVELQLPVESRVLGLIAEAGTGMQMAPDTWEGIRRHVSV